MQFIAHSNVPYTNRDGRESVNHVVNPQPFTSKRRINRVVRRAKAKNMVLTFVGNTLRIAGSFCGILESFVNGVNHVWNRINNSRALNAFADMLEALECIVFNFKDWCSDKSFRMAFSFVSVFIFALGILSGLFMSGLR